MSHSEKISSFEAAIKERYFDQHKYLFELMTIEHTYNQAGPEGRELLRSKIKSVSREIIQITLYLDHVYFFLKGAAENFPRPVIFSLPNGCMYYLPSIKHAVEWKLTSKSIKKMEQDVKLAASTYINYKFDNGNIRWKRRNTTKYPI